MAEIKEKEFTLRELTAEDIFPLSDIISKIGIEKIMELTMGAKEDDPVVGAKMIGVIIGNLTYCKKELFEFLSSITGVDKKEIQSLKAKEFTLLVKQVIKNDDFKDFFKGALELLA